MFFAQELGKAMVATAAIGCGAIIGIWLGGRVTQAADAGISRIPAILAEARAARAEQRADKIVDKAMDVMTTPAAPTVAVV